ncbi:MAG: NUDIX domain-containing protein [Candidatus Aenigmatarchaeota archaeon]
MKVVRAGAGIIVLKDGKVLLGKRNDDPEKADTELHTEGMWTCPGGKIDFGEKAIDAAKRELMEETGIRGNDLKVVAVTDHIVPDAHFVTLGFLCKEFEGEPKVMEPEEITEWRWFPINKLPEPINYASLKVIDNYLKGKIYNGD